MQEWIASGRQPWRMIIQVAVSAQSSDQRRHALFPHPERFNKRTTGTVHLQRNEAEGASIRSTRIVQMHCLDAADNPPMSPL